MESFVVEEKLRFHGHEVECVWVLLIFAVCACAALMFRKVKRCRRSIV